MEESVQLDNTYLVNTYDMSLKLTYMHFPHFTFALTQNRSWDALTLGGPGILELHYGRCTELERRVEWDEVEAAGKGQIVGAV